VKLSLASRIFLGYALVLVTFGAVSLFSVTELHRNQLEIRLVSQGYLQLSQEAAAIETFHTNQEKDTARLLEEQNPETRRALVRLARLYYPPLIRQRLEAARAQTQEVLAFAPASELPFVQELAQRFGELSQRQSAYGGAADTVYAALARGEPALIHRTTGELRQQETSIGRDIRYLRAALDNRIRERVQQAEERERRTGLWIITLSLLAVCVGLAATVAAARTLSPVRTLIEGVIRIGRGDYTAQLGVRGQDEVAVLAREFDAMAKSLRAREQELRAQQEALLRAEQLAAVGRISAQVAHEVRNPLSSIGLNVELLEEAISRAPFATEAEAREAKDILAAVTREVDRLTEVTEQYLRLARPPSPTPEPEHLPELLGGVLDFAREELERAGVAVVRELPQDTPPALADEAQLRQVLLNLLRNAREAMPSGGTLTVSTRGVEDGGKAWVEVAFRDTGHGMSEEVRQRIFEPFFSTKSQGTGLGLAVSQQILQAHGGSLTCLSSPGEGTTFVLRLPRA
jgi:two-component system, NtrC family, sensor kinase